MSKILPEIETWSDERWELTIRAAVDQVKSDLSNGSSVGPTPFSSVATSSDPILPLTIDHTLLKPEATLEQIDQLCDEALKYNFKASAMDLSRTTCEGSMPTNVPFIAL